MPDPIEIHWCSACEVYKVPADFFKAMEAAGRIDVVRVGGNA